jgi:cell division control protein 6
MGITTLEKELRSSTVFKDRSKLSPEYVPPRLPCRDEEYRMLIHYFRPLLEGYQPTAPKVMIRGRIGVGKTALAKRFGYDIELFAHRRGMNIRCVHANCREDGSSFSLLRNVVTVFERSFPLRGVSTEEAFQSLIKVLKERNAYLILVLDELEALIRREGSTFLYNLLRVQEAKDEVGPRLSLICIFRDPGCESILRGLDRSVLSMLEPNTIHLASYTPNELEIILKERVVEAFKVGAVNEEAIELVSDVAGEAGDARYAIQLLERAGIIADLESSPQVLPQHVREARIDLPPDFRRDVIWSLTPHEKLILLALTRGLKQSSGAYLTMGELRKSYRVACEEYVKKPLGYTQFWKSVRFLSTIGVVIAKKSGAGYRGKTTLVNTPISVDLLERELERMLG